MYQARASAEETQKEATHYAAVARDYREICARLDKQLHNLQVII